MNNRFRFHGYAIGAAASFEKPFTDLIESQAVSALPQIGGRSSARTEHFRYRDIFKFDLAQSEVTGSKCEGECGSPEGSYNTHVQCTVEGLDVLSMVTADRIVANLVSTDTTSPDGEPSVRLIGTRFENLRIAGIPVKVDLGTEIFDRYDTHRALAAAYREDEAVRARIDRPGANNAGEAPGHIRGWLHVRESKAEMPATRGRTCTSLVDKVTAERGGLDVWGHVIYVKGFGVIRLAEIEINQRTRLVNMLQIEFDCPYRARAMFCEIADGGDGY